MKMTPLKILTAALVCTSVAATAQVSVSAKAHLLFPTDSPSWQNVTTVAEQAYETSGKSNVGFNAGLSVKINLISGLFVMPELYYTTFKNELTDPISKTTVEAKSNRADLPVLVGFNVLGESLGIYAGPVASYNLSTDNQYDDFVENARNEFTVGYQLGVQFKIQKLIFSGRYEGSISEDQREFINETTNQTIRYDNRPGMFLAGIGYQF
ncbi:outer membrane beta-barrel protein [Chryseobacterium sp. MFBS3-17]|uniref:outer membrane beta-barrel protein n=1 Tax=Chryseobacterium sp. MFBS3-17 TaxID=2886689 RepID=UPI001D0F0C79|nr:outer membrane beta-barrel protein [Chryseobacterium sp. MFBS3-17]